MANYQTLKSAIQQVIKTNHNNEISGTDLQQALLAMINSLGEGYQFMGVATPTTNPGTLDSRAFYIANGKGTYTSFGDLSVTEDDVVILYWDSSWHKMQTGIASQEKLTDLERKTDNISAEEVETEDEEIIVEDNDGNEVVNITPNGVDCKNLKSNGKDVATKEDVESLSKETIQDRNEEIYIEDNGEKVLSLSKKGILSAKGFAIIGGGHINMPTTSSPNLFSLNREGNLVLAGWTKTANGAYTNSTNYGIASKFLIDMEFAIKDRCIVWDFTPSSAGTFYFGMYPSKYNLQARARSVAFIDLSRGKIGTLEQVATNEMSPDTMTDIASESAITGYTSLVGKRLRLYVKKGQCKLQRLDTLEVVGSNDVVGYMFERPFCFATATMLLHNVIVNTTITDKYNTFAMFFGDSITEGAGATTENNAFAYMTAEHLGNSLVSGRSGGNVLNVIERLKTEAVNLRPKFVVVTIGTNFGNTKERLRMLIDGILSIGATPILNHIPMMVNKNDTIATNTLIDEVMAEYGIKISCARMDVATAINGDPTQGQDSSLFVSDHVHPNNAGHLKMYHQLFIDVPEMFNNLYSHSL